MSNARRSSEHSGRWSRLLFDADEKNYEIWEIKFLGHLRLQGLKGIITSEPEGDETEEEVASNAEAYAEMIQFLDNKSLSLVMREAADDGARSAKDTERLLCR